MTIPLSSTLSLPYTEFYVQTNQNKQGAEMNVTIFNQHSFFQIFYHPPNTKQFCVHASGSLVDSCLPVATIIKNKMYQRPKRQDRAKMRKIRDKMKRDFQKVVLRTRTISSASTPLQTTTSNMNI